MGEMFRLTCPGCGWRFATELVAGKQDEGCPQCGARITLGGRAPSPINPVPSTPAVPGRSPGASQPGANQPGATKSPVAGAVPAATVEKLGDEEDLLAIPLVRVSPSTLSLFALAPLVFWFLIPLVLGAGLYGWVESERAGSLRKELAEVQAAVGDVPKFRPKLQSVTGSIQDATQTMTYAFGTAAVLLLTGFILFLTVISRCWRLVNDGRAALTPREAVGVLIMPVLAGYFVLASAALPGVVEQVGLITIRIGTGVCVCLAAFFARRAFGDLGSQFGSFALRYRLPIPDSAGFARSWCQIALLGGVILTGVDFLGWVSGVDGSKIETMVSVDGLMYLIGTGVGLVGFLVFMTACLTFPFAVTAVTGAATDLSAALTLAAEMSGATADEGVV